MVVAGGHQTAFARAAQILRREEAEAADGAHRARALFAVFGADGLRGVFDDWQAVAFGDRHDRLHLGALAEEMNGEDGLRAWRDRALDYIRIDVEIVRRNVHEDGARAQPRDRAGGGEESERRRDDLVARPHAQGRQRQQQRVGPGAASDSMSDLAMFGGVSLERFDFRAEDEMLAFKHSLDRGHHLAADCLKLRAQIQKRNIHLFIFLSHINDDQSRPESFKRYHSIVFFSPSSTGTRGSHPSTSFARVMSGLRVFGSSSGSGRYSILLRLPVSRRIIFANSRMVISFGLPMLTGLLNCVSISRRMPSIRSSTY